MGDAEKAMDQKIENECNFLKSLKIALPAKAPEHEDALYSKGEFCDGQSIINYYRNGLSQNMKREMKRRKKQVERERKRLGGPIILWTFKDMKKGKKIMSEATVEKKDEKKETEKPKEKKATKVEKKKVVKKKGKVDKKKKTKSNNKKSRGPRVVDGKITLIEKTNPKREKSKAWKRYELYRKHKTIAGYLEAGGKRSSLRYDEKHGYIKTSGIKTTKDEKKKDKE